MTEVSLEKASQIVRTEVSVESSLKRFNTSKGFSSGSTVRSCLVGVNEQGQPCGISLEQVLEEKFRLDNEVLEMEAMRGMVSAEELKEGKAALKNNFEILRKKYQPAS